MANLIQMLFQAPFAKLGIVTRRNLAMPTGSQRCLKFSTKVRWPERLKNNVNFGVDSLADIDSSQSYGRA